MECVELANDAIRKCANDGHVCVDRVRMIDCGSEKPLGLDQGCGGGDGRLTIDSDNDGVGSFDWG